MNIEQFRGSISKDPYLANYYKRRNEMICQEYKDCNTTVENIAKKYYITPRSVQRICKTGGVIRTIAEANKLTAKHKDYSSLKVPEELKAKRKTVPKRLRYKLIHERPFCTNCGAVGNQCPLQIDHIDGNATNNDISNLQVLCMECNYGKR